MCTLGYFLLLSPISIAAISAVLEINRLTPVPIAPPPPHFLVCSCGHPHTRWARCWYPHSSWCVGLWLFSAEDISQSQWTSHTETGLYALTEALLIYILDYLDVNEGLLLWLTKTLKVETSYFNLPHFRWLLNSVPVQFRWSVIRMLYHAIFDMSSIDYTRVFMGYTHCVCMCCMC